jgi:hypothetical protein
MNVAHDESEIAKAKSEVGSLGVLHIQWKSKETREALWRCQKLK